jgi:hypothetical protein
MAVSDVVCLIVLDCVCLHLIGSRCNPPPPPQVAAKAAEHVDAAGRARMCRLAMALPALSQGVPFFHAADDLLRSKSLDRDSYNSGGRG